MQKRRLLGISLIVLGLAVILAKPLGITAAVVGLRTIESSWFYVIGTVLVIGGLILQHERTVEEGGLEKLSKKQKKIVRNIDNALRSGKLGTYDELRNIAGVLGYELKEEGSHTKVYVSKEENKPLMYKGHPVTIPRSHEKEGTYRGILQGLRYGLAAA